MSEETILINATTTSQGLYLTELGSFDDDPAADDVYEFALKSNNNFMTLDQTVERTNDTYLNMQQLRSKGLLGRVMYGGRTGVDDDPTPA
jgi:hypothetical protein